MKPNKKDIHITSTLEGEDVEMDIAKGAAVHLMSLLTDLYSDQEYAVLREYSTNAYDSHVEAGIERPIEVELPTPLRASLVIRDFGVGLNADDIKEIYSQYGASTKRESNEYNGLLGVGCKSALTYTDQFTIKAVKSGIKTLVSVSRGENGGGTMKILSEEKVSEENGVEITIPARSVNEFEKKAKKFFRFWEPGTVLINGKQPEKVSGIPVCDNIIVLKEDNFDQQSYIVQGNVPYPVDFPTIAVNIAAWVPIGTVDFAPSREALADTDLTKKAIKSIEAKYKSRYKDYTQKKLDEATNKYEALRVYSELFFMGSLEAKYKGEDIPKEFIHEDGNKIIHIGVRDYYRYTQRKNIYSHIASVDSRQILGKYWIINFDNKHFTTQMKEKMRGYIAEKLGEETVSLDRSFVVNDFDKIKNNEWIDPNLVFNWKEAKKFKVPANNYVQTKETYYHTYVNGVEHPTYDSKNIDKTKPIFYTILKRGEEGNSWGNKQLSDIYDEYSLVAFHNYRKAKFLRSFPNAIELNGFLKERAEKWWSKLDDDKKKLLFWEPDYYESRIVDFIGTNRAQKVKEERIKNLLKKKEEKENLLKKIEPEYNKYKGWISQESEVEASNLLADYPILYNVVSSYYGSESKAKRAEHVVIYINAAHEHLQKEKV